MTAIDDLKAEVIRLAHPAANVFPLMSDDELQGLADDIKANKLRDPLCHDDAGRIVDGRNRWIACQVSGVEARSLPLPQDISAVDYVISHNLHRRNLTPSQRAACAADLATLKHGANQYQQVVGVVEDGSIDPSTSGMSNVQAAALLGVGTAQVKRAKTIKRESPEAFERVKRGEVSIHTAMKEIGKPLHRSAKTGDKKPKAQRVAHSGKPNLRVVEPQMPGHIGRLRAWLVSGSTLFAEFQSIGSVDTELARYGVTPEPHLVDDCTSFVAALAAAAKAVRAA